MVEEFSNTFFGDTKFQKYLKTATFIFALLTGFKTRELI